MMKGSAARSELITRKGHESSATKFMPSGNVWGHSRAAAIGVVGAGAACAVVAAWGVVGVTAAAADACVSTGVASAAGPEVGVPAPTTAVSAAWEGGEAPTLGVSAAALDAPAGWPATAILVEAGVAATGAADRDTMVPPAAAGVPVLPADDDLETSITAPKLSTKRSNTTIP